MKKNKISWLEYMSALQQRTFTPEQLNREELKKLLNISYLTHAVFNHSIPWIYLLDYTRGQYLLTSSAVKTILGYEPRYFLEGGLSAILENYEKNHLRLFNEEIFPDRLQFLKKIPSEEHPNFIFSYNLRLKRHDGVYVDLLQRSCFVKSDEERNPLFSFGVLTNVNHYKNENPIIQIVEKINNTDVFGSTDVQLKKAYYLNREDQLFTKREREIMLWLADGLSCKEIADKLFISEHTVINHKTSMMRKTHSNNVAELVSFAIRNQLC
jgi:DNA-binding CsgD family transcriptional regulator